MPTDLPPDYKPSPPPAAGGDSLDPGAAPATGGQPAPGDIGGDVVDGGFGTGPGRGAPQPGPANGPGIPGSPGGDAIDTGLPGTVPAI